ncbi:MAG: hypothetical protein IJR88_04140 [Clostridia bacterium]|nr:hypothetical protein [Clostridia bacterium]
MLLKICGCGLLFVSALAASVWKLRKARRQLLLLEGWIDFLTFVRGEIGSRMTPLFRILEATDPAFFELLGAKEKRLEDYLCASEKDLDRDSLEALSSFAAACETSYRADLLASCDRALFTLSQKRQELASELPKEKRRTFSISLLAVGLVILLFW